MCDSYEAYFLTEPTRDLIINPLGEISYGDRFMFACITSIYLYGAPVRARARARVRVRVSGQGQGQGQT